MGCVYDHLGVTLLPRNPLPQAEATGDTGLHLLCLLLRREDGVKLDLLSTLESTLSPPCLPGHMVCREAAPDWVFGRWRELC